MRRTLALLVLLAGCPEPEPIASPPEPTPPVDDTPALVSGVEVVQVSVNQAVEVQLIAGDARLAAEDRRVPLIAGRDALVRVYVQAVTGWTPREVVATLRLVSLPGGEEVETQELQQFVQTTSTADDPASTFDFELPGDLLAPNLGWSVELREVEAGAFEGGSSAAAFPRPDGDQLPDFAPLGVTDWGGVVRVHVIPVRYNADGSGRLPDLSDEQKQRYEDWMRGMYPVRELSIEYGEPWDTDILFTPQGDGFGDVLEAMRTVRVEREVPWDRYVYALVQPADSFQTFCNLGCTLGLSYRVANPAQMNLRVSIGAGFPGDSAAWTMAHEIGHAHDRGHSPCGNPSNVDTGYPYGDGGTGVWGWNPATGERYSPADSSDIMGYCDGKWISDYQYAALHDRVSFFEGIEEPPADEEEREWRRVGVRPEGLVAGAPERLVGEPGGEPVTVELLDADGAVIGTAEAHLAPFAHGEGGTLLVPATDAAAIRYEGLTTAL